MTLQDLPIHDFENDPKISDKRKEACRIDYLNMELQHLDKIFTSAYAYDKKTGEPIAKKPKSLHEIVYNLMLSAVALTVEVQDLKNEIQELKKNVITIQNMNLTSGEAK